MTRFLIICAGGALGTGARYATAVMSAKYLGVEVPYGTLFVNLAGALIIGFVQQLAVQALLVSDDVRLFLTTGMMGGLTTYSTFTYETVRLAQDGAWRGALLNIAVTTGACLALCLLGMVAATALVGRR